jgi:hypothetical protein
MRIRYQKNQDNYQVLTYSAATASPNTCPIQAILCILQHGVHLRLPPLHPLAIRANHSDPLGFSFVTGTEYTKRLQSVAATVYRLPPKDPAIARWGTHSLCDTATNLLQRTQFLASFIKNRLRWKSNSFLMYLRNTFYMADQHSRALDLGLLPPPLAESRPLKPHKDALIAMAT